MNGRNMNIVGQAERWRVMCTLAVFGVAMGWMEAVVVEYIRRVIGMAAGMDFSQYMLDQGIDSAASFLAFLESNRILWVERTRETATIVMLLCVSLLSFRRWRLRCAAFLWTFAIWDLSYYTALTVRLDWPRALSEIDCLFLIPIPWFAPVWAPLVVMACLIAYAVLLVRRY
jgi:hypothetical protein